MDMTHHKAGRHCEADAVTFLVQQIRVRPSEMLSTQPAPFSRFQNLRHVAGNDLLKFASLGVQGCEFFIQGFELFIEVLVADFLTRNHADVAARIQAPTLRLDLFDCGRLA